MLIITLGYYEYVEVSCCSLGQDFERDLHTTLRSRLYRANMTAAVPPILAANHQIFWRRDETAVPLLVAAGAGAGSVAAAAVYSKAGTNGKKGTESKL